MRGWRWMLLRRGVMVRRLEGERAVVISATGLDGAMG